MRVERDYSHYSLKREPPAPFRPTSESSYAGLSTFYGIYMPPLNLVDAVSVYAHEAGHWIVAHNYPHTGLAASMLEVIKPSLGRSIELAPAAIEDMTREQPFVGHQRQAAISVFRSIWPLTDNIPTFSLTEEEFRLKIIAEGVDTCEVEGGNLHFVYTKEARESELYAKLFEIAAMFILENSLKTYSIETNAFVMRSCSVSPSHQRAQNIAARLLGLL